MPCDFSDYSEDDFDDCLGGYDSDFSDDDSDCESFCTFESDESCFSETDCLDTDLMPYMGRRGGPYGRHHLGRF
jgi:hypothetical protein